MPDPVSASDHTCHGRDRVLTIFQGILRGAQARGWTDEALGEGSGVNPRAIKSYRVEGKEPCLSNALSLMGVLGPGAVNAVLSAIRYSGAAPMEEEGALDPRQIIAEILPQISVIATAAADGRIDHTEQPDCEKAADAIIAIVTPLSSARRGA